LRLISNPVGIGYNYNKLKAEPIILYGRFDERKTTFEGFRLYGFDVHVPVEFGEDDSFDICNISLWTESGLL
jgi:hypothetical protein